MPEAPAAPPPTPAAPPAAAPTPAPAAAPKPGASTPPASKTRNVNPAQSLADAYKMLDEMAGPETGTPADFNPKDPPKPPADPNNPPQETPGKPADATEPKPGDQPAKPEKAATLRQLKDQYEAENKVLKQRVKEFEEKLSKPADDTEIKSLREKLTARETRLQELEEEQKFSNYERSSEYKDKFETPFIKAYQAGANKVASLKVTNSETGEARQATQADFDSIMRITDDDAAADRAFELFGNKASIVMYHREEVQKLNNARVEALDTYRKEGGAREKQRAEAMQKGQQEVAEHFNAEIKRGVEKYKWFKADTGDAKAQEILDRGMSLADAAFAGGFKDPETGKLNRLAPKELAELHAAVRNKAGGFDHVAYLLNKERARVKELEASLKEYEESGPGGGGGGRTPKKAMSTWDEIDADLGRRATRG